MGPARTVVDLQQEYVSKTDAEYVYIQPPTVMDYPCILIEPDADDVTYADGQRYFVKGEYTVTVIAREPDSSIVNQVSDFRYTRRLRTNRVNGLNHTIFQVFF